jgi:hypothetical protein
MTEDGRQKAHRPCPQSSALPNTVLLHPPSALSEAILQHPPRGLQASAAPPIACVSPQTSRVYHLRRPLSVGKTRNRRAAFP